MPDYCKNCGAKLNKNNKFCPECGKPIEDKSKSTFKSMNSSDRKLIIVLAIAAVLLIIGIAITVTSLPTQTNQLELETYDFGYLTMSVPKGSDFAEYDNVGKGTAYWAIGYTNKGEDRSELVTVWISNYEGSNYLYDYVETDGDLEVYSILNNNTYIVKRTVDGYTVELTGIDDLDDLKKMAQSIEVKNPTTTSTTQSSTTSSSGSSTPSSLSILGGSFSTGSAESDKTYASINVGTQNAGKDVIVQIWYSRDGNTLNNGNMVPATVHSDGHLEIASADAYHYYPDHATINIYDSNSHLLTTKSVSLSPQSGTQTF